MKNVLFSIVGILLLNQYSVSQKKIKADLEIMNFLGNIPYKTEKNSETESLLRMIYFKPQPKNSPRIGFMNNKGEVRIEPSYEMASDFYDGYANIIKDSIYGYIDKNGTEVLFKQYMKTYFWYGDVGIAKKDGKVGLIDRTGNPITEFIYNEILFYGFNHFKGIISKDKNHILDKKGNIIFNKKLEYNIKSDYFQKDSLLIYEKEIDNKKLKGLVSLKNDIVTEPKYDNIYFINDEDFFVVKKNEKYGFINKLGIEVIPIIYDKVEFNITENLIAVKQNNKCGFINKNNEIIIPLEYDETYPFFDGIAIVKKEKSYIGINKKNKTKINLGTESSKFPFLSNDLCVFKENDKFGYKNKNGKIIIPPLYEYAYPFVNGIAYVELNKKSGFINKKGKEIIPIKYNQLWLENDGLIRFVK